MSFSATMTLRVEWGHCDPAGIVFYPNYFRWFDAAAWNLFEVAGMGWDEIRKRYGDVRIPLLAAESRFQAPSRQGDRPLVESRVTTWERKVFRVEHRVTNNGTVAAEGLETRCWAVPHDYEPNRMRGAVLPAEIIALFEGRGG